jgi:hypothetical protein
MMLTINKITLTTNGQHFYTEICAMILRELTEDLWWYMPVIPALRRLRKEDHVFQVSLGYAARPCLKKTEKEEEGEEGGGEDGEEEEERGGGKRGGGGSRELRGRMRSRERGGREVRRERRRKKRRKERSSTTGRVCHIHVSVMMLVF